MAMQHKNTRPDKTYLSYEEKKTIEKNKWYSLVAPMNFTPASLFCKTSNRDFSWKFPWKKKKSTHRFKRQPFSEKPGVLLKVIGLSPLKNIMQWNIHIIQKERIQEILTYWNVKT